MNEVESLVVIIIVVVVALGVLVITVIVIIMVVIMVTVVITVVVIVAVIVAVMVVVVVVVVIIVGDVATSLILGDTSSTEWNLCFGRLPVTNTLELGGIIVMSSITALGDSNNGATGIPAAVGDIVVVQLGGDGDVAGKHEASESEKLCGTHDD